MSKYKSGVIEGATFESQENGDDREATVMTVVVEKGFPVSARSIVILEVDEINQLQQRIEDYPPLKQRCGGLEKELKKAKELIHRQHLSIKNMAKQMLSKEVD